MKIVNTEQAPKAIGPYVQAKIVGDLLFTSGQLPIHPKDNKMPKTIQEQTRQSLKNIESILKAGGSSLDQVLKTTVYLKNIEDFSAMNEVYAEFFPTVYPARSAFSVAALPLGALVEIEVVAHIEK